MTAPSTFAKVEEAIVARITALDASAYTLGRLAKAKWHESDAPLSVISDTSALGHLSFGVWISTAPNSNDGRGVTWVNNGIDNLVEIDARLTVAFAFQLRPTVSVADSRVATEAAHDVVVAAMAAWTADDEATYGTVTVRLVDAMQTAVSLDGDWLLITQSYITSFDLDLLPE
jgi:hypothetical protein